MASTEENNLSQLLRLFPNPVLNQFTVELPEGLANPIQFDLHSWTGQTQTIPFARESENQYRFELESMDLPEGYYILGVQTGQHYISRKFIVLKP